MKTILILLLMSLTQLSLGQCFFDHQVLTLPTQKYQSFLNVFQNPTIKGYLNSEVKMDSSGQKFFIMFKNSSYIEVWNEDKFSNYGTQEAFRTQYMQQLNSISYYMNINISPYYTLGTNGAVGNPKGGMFYSYNGEPAINSRYLGITDIKKNISANLANQLYRDYGLCQVSRYFDYRSNAIRVKDVNGVNISAYINNATNVLRELTISTNSNINQTVSIYKNDYEDISLVFTTGEAKLVFR